MSFPAALRTMCPSRAGPKSGSPVPRTGPGPEGCHCGLVDPNSPPNSPPPGLALRPSTVGSKRVFRALPRPTLPALTPSGLVHLLAASAPSWSVCLPKLADGTVLEGGRGQSPEAHLSPSGRGCQRLGGGAPLRVAWEGAGEPEWAVVQPSPADLPPGLSSDSPPLLQARVKVREPASPLTAPVPVFYELLISPGSRLACLKEC